MSVAKDGEIRSMVEPLSSMARVVMSSPLHIGPRLKSPITAAVATRVFVAGRGLWGIRGGWGLWWLRWWLRCVCVCVEEKRAKFKWLPKVLGLYVKKAGMEGGNRHLGRNDMQFSLICNRYSYRAI